MKVGITIKPDIKDFESSIKLLNVIFSKYDKNRSDYNAQTAYKKTRKSNNTVIFEVKKGNELVAFAICYERYSDYYHIWQLGVKEDYRRKGLASKIYKYVENFAKGKKYKGITLNTFNRFHSNVNLIIKRGYKIYDLDKRGVYRNDPKIMFKFDFYKRYSK